MSFKVISAEEAALHIHDDDNVGFGGFTAAGTPKVVPQAIAAGPKKSTQPAVLSVSAFLPEPRPATVSMVLCPVLRR